MIRMWLVLILSVIALAQNTRPKLSFEAASIKPGPPGNLMDLMRAGALYVKTDDSQFSAGSFSLSSLVQRAFNIPQDQIVAPEWLQEPRFNVQAKLPPGSSKDQVPAMLVTLLEDRFKMTWHRDQKTLPVYALMVAKDGPKLRESPPGDSSPGPGGCSGGFHKVCEHTTMENLALMLTRFANIHALGALDRPVIDETGLTGKYDFDFDQGIHGGRGGRGADAAAPQDNPEEVTAFQALKVLGLRLEPVKHAYDYIVIDHIERTPTDN